MTQYHQQLCAATVTHCQRRVVSAGPASDRFATLCKHVRGRQHVISMCCLLFVLLGAVVISMFSSTINQGYPWNYDLIILVSSSVHSRKLEVRQDILKQLSSGIKKGFTLQAVCQASFPNGAGLYYIVSLLPLDES